MAQKTSRLEKLLRYLNDNDADKWQKNRDKIKMTRRKPTMPKNWHCWTFSTNCGTNKVEQSCHQLFSAVTNKLRKSLFSEYLRRREKYSFPTYNDKAEARLFMSILEHRKSRFPLARHLMDSIQSSGYPAELRPLAKGAGTSCELALLEGMLKAPALNISQTYISEYPNGKFISQINTAENKRLYQIVRVIRPLRISKHSLIMPPSRKSSLHKSSSTSLPFGKSARYTTTFCFKGLTSLQGEKRNASSYPVYH